MNKALKELLELVKVISVRQEQLVSNLREIVEGLEELVGDDDCGFVCGHGESGCDHPIHKNQPEP